ncbi:hypothetical protein OE88DRAFT_1069146 [Heliocybe sulcata]|uniref:Uncharacterized protein n=1 Tax=Heliocybe sulcata TaxID=5364 RepID=A0A5C3MMH2_9AGAM|nr:hypothetical protein OE88DRAFT_1069146 [Heliocybe sulcata]
MRRRRAARFDDEVDEAARQAAMSSAVPYFPDDDDDDFNMRNAAKQYEPTVTSHGTYAQPPMGAESYGMREIQPGQVMPQAGPPPVPYDPATYGMAGVGVQRARSRRDPNEGPETTPYNRFASPPIPEQYQDPMGARYHGGNGTDAAHNWDILQAAGLAGASQDPYAAVNANLRRGPSSSQGGHTATSGSTSLNRQPSFGASGLLSSASNPSPPTSQESYAAHYKSSPSPPMPNPHVAPALDNRKSVVSAMDDPYGGIEDNHNPHAHAIPNPFDNTEESEEGHGQSHAGPPPEYDRGDAASVVEESDGKRVLRVANE